MKRRVERTNKFSIILNKTGISRVWVKRDGMWFFGYMADKCHWLCCAACYNFSWWITSTVNIRNIVGLPNPDPLLFLSFGDPAPALGLDPPFHSALWFNYDHFIY